MYNVFMIIYRSIYNHICSGRLKESMFIKESPFDDDGSLFDLGR